MEKIYKGEIQRLMPIFQAMADGKTIQNKNSNGWVAEWFILPIKKVWQRLFMTNMTLQQKPQEQRL